MAFVTNLEACDAISNNCTGSTTFYLKNVTTISVGVSVYTDNQATQLASTGYYVLNNNIIYIQNGVVISITACSTCGNLTSPELYAAGNLSICNGETTTLSTNCNVGTVKWYKNNQLLSNSNNSLVVGYNDTGTYTVKCFCGGNESSASNSIIITQNSNCSTVLIPVNDIFIGNPNMYTNSNTVYDTIMNRYMGTPNVQTTIYTSTGLTVGSSVYTTNSTSSLVETGFMAYYNSGQLKTITIVNGVITNISNSTQTPLSNTTTIYLNPSKHYDTSGQYVGVGHAWYNGNDFDRWESKLEVASDGLTITDLYWNNANSGNYIKKWRINKGEEKAVPLINYKLSDIYKGQVVDIQITHYLNGIAQQNYWYSILIGK